METLLARPVVIGLAIAGALFAVAASVLQKKGMVTAALANRLNTIGYVLMGASMLLFVIIGVRGETP